MSIHIKMFLKPEIQRVSMKEFHTMTTFESSLCFAPLSQTSYPPFPTLSYFFILEFTFTLGFRGMFPLSADSKICLHCFWLTKEIIPTKRVRTLKVFLPLCLVGRKDLAILCVKIFVRILLFTSVFRLWSKLKWCYRIRAKTIKSVRWQLLCHLHSKDRPGCWLCRSALLTELLVDWEGEELSDFCATDRVRP